MRALAAVLGAFWLAGCVPFEPKPIVPAATARFLENRSLTNQALRSFLSANLQRSFTNWPAAAWDLDMLTLAAFYYHPSLNVARADWSVARSGVHTAAERPNPTVTASAAYEPARDALSPWIPGLIFDLPVETAGKRRLRSEQARHFAEAARFNLATAAWQVRSGVRTRLIAFAAARGRVDLLQRQVALREEHAQRIESQFQAGAIAAAERNVSRLALVRAQADLQDARRILAEARPQLANALGLPEAGLPDVQILYDLAASPGLDEPAVNRVRELALRGRSDVLSALAEYAASQSALQLETAKQYPNIHLAPGYSWNAGSTGEHDWQIGATVELPLLNRHQGPIAEAAARREASAARFLAVQAKVICEVDLAMASFHGSKTNVLAFDTLVSSQMAEAELIEQQFQAGAVDRLDVLLAALELNTAQLARFDAQVRRQQALGALEDAMQRPYELPPVIYEAKSALNLKPE